MIKISNFMYKISAVIIVSLYGISFDSFAAVKTICPAGKYVSKCGNYYVGTNWLKGYTKTDVAVYTQDGESLTAEYKDNTPNYFDYSNNADETNMKNLRNLFSLSDTIIYTEQSSNSADVMMNSADSKAYKDVRDEMLNKFCNPNDTTITCETCPGNGTVRASTFDTTSFKWVAFKTIADCYMKEFTDATGTYVNISSDGDVSNCYFTADVQYVGGTSLNDTNPQDTTYSPKDVPQRQ